MSKTPELLPLGSAVQIEDDEGVYIIIARGFQKHEDGFLAGYKAVPHPQGAAPGVRELVIRHTQITKVLHPGHASEKDAEFAKELLENARTPPKARPVPAAEPDLTVDLTAPTMPVAPAAPVAATGGERSSPDVGQDVRDPFGELRRKGRRT
ncbi:hypothetical protein J2Y69_000092 [Microbacterium resistens]|uniref:DUF4176 domain-containing protein n=1 Tax=Microbacterium resistens TaxID=156977 RepID=A0ABU1S7D9_9MICO|nr:DUF4176 domain-containing protein [Microbacterium resistens]MDR6865510.1 hypothetical protein [Microbacterium resistens]